LVSNSLSNVFYQKISSNKVSFGGIKKLTFKLTFFLFLLILPFVIIIHFYGSNIFAFVFGETWRLAGEFSSILIFGYAASFISSPLSVILNLKKNIKLDTLGQFVQLTTLILVLIYYISSPINTLVYTLAI
jgi:O-antigen/teichoic acid export membrane protein